MGVVIRIGTREVLVPDPDPEPTAEVDAHVWMERFIDGQVLNLQHLVNELTDCYENPAYGRELIRAIKTIVGQWPG